MSDPADFGAAQDGRGKRRATIESTRGNRASTPFDAVADHYDAWYDSVELVASL